MHSSPCTHVPSPLTFTPPQPAQKWAQKDSGEVQVKDGICTVKDIASGQPETVKWFCEHMCMPTE